MCCWPPDMLRADYSVLQILQHMLQMGSITKDAQIVTSRWSMSYLLRYRFPLYDICCFILCPTPCRDVLWCALTKPRQFWRAFAACRTYSVGGLNLDKQGHHLPSHANAWTGHCHSKSMHGVHPLEVGKYWASFLSYGKHSVANPCLSLTLMRSRCPGSELAPACWWRVES